MGDFTFNAALGRVIEKVSDAPGNIGVILLKTAEADATLKTYATLAALLAAGGGAANVECNFTNYARKTGITGTITGGNVDIPDQSWSSAGGVLDNTVVKLIVYYEEASSDASRIPLTAHDFSVTTNSTNLTAQVNTSGFFGATSP